MSPPAAPPRRFSFLKTSPARPSTFTSHDLQSRRGLAHAHRAFTRDGVISLDDVFDTTLLADAHRAFVDRYDGLGEDELVKVGSRVGHERYMISVAWATPFDDPGLWINRLVEAVLGRVLGPGFVLNSYALVAAYPGAADQHVHLDHQLLFEGPLLSRALPPYAATLAVPLIDLGPQTGGTQVWIGSHRRLPGFVARRSRGQLLCPPRGGAYLMDYRLLHGGTQNPGVIARPVLYIAYSRPWFRDAANFRQHPPIRITRAQRDLLPDHLRVRIPPATGVD